MSSRVQSIIHTGASGLIIDIECSLSNNLPRIVIVGFANKAVDEAKERIRGAFADSGLYLPRKRITINLAPADVPKADSGFDLAIAVSILAASQQIPPLLEGQQAFLGELGLDGSTRAIRGIVGKLLAGRAQGLKTFYVPSANLPQAQLVPGIAIYPVSSLNQLIDHLGGTTLLQRINTGRGRLSRMATTLRYDGLALSDIAGQPLAKRALEIAAAGGHNVFLSGPPGTGKSMLAKALPSLLPPLEREEVLEVTHLHSLASHNYERIITERPFRAPHHSVSHIAVVGGGAALRPGEISLAHRGVLFFDELPEFNRATLEALRQPLEDRFISVARAKDSADFPANFILVATANPCPCGYYGSETACSCKPSQVLQYQQRLSGPILDRIDLYSAVQAVEHERLLANDAPVDSDTVIRERITAARQRQRQRFGSSVRLNADMTNSDIKLSGRLKPAATALLNRAASNLGLSARAYIRTVRVARTIADLANCDDINTSHIGDALAYRAYQHREH